MKDGSATELGGNEPIKFHRRFVTCRSNGRRFDLQKKQLQTAANCCKLLTVKLGASRSGFILGIRMRRKNET